MIIKCAWFKMYIISLYNKRNVSNSFRNTDQIAWDYLNAVSHTISMLFHIVCVCVELTKSVDAKSIAIFYVYAEYKVAWDNTFRTKLTNTQLECSIVYAQNL